VEAVAAHSDQASPPRHVAIIMDGNGRWAQARGLPRSAGHRNGAQAVRRAVEAAGDIGVEYLTLFGFSSENWKRPAREISDLMGLLRRYLRSETGELVKNGVRLQVIGELDALADDIVEMIRYAERETRHNTRLNLVIALNYGSRNEIVAAARDLARAAAAGEIAPEAIDQDIFAARLLTAGIPDPDLVIRTSGEQRLSNFLLWQSAYSELLFLDLYWPDFRKSHLLEAVQEFHGRERRFGA
jgi:undecaprenyl diphosphate synthase